VPEGVEIEVAVPDFSKSPGFEAWLEDEEWSRERVFSDISKWHYHKDSKKYKAVWNALGHWHSVNRLARAMEPGATTIHHSRRRGDATYKLNVGGDVVYHSIYRP